MAINFYDIAYGFGLGVSAPVWVVRSKTRQKVLTAFAQRMGAVPSRGTARAVMIHAVSVGEINAARGLIDALQSREPGLHIILSTTTQTGYDRAEALYNDRSDVTFIRYPLDFSAAVRRVLDALRPSLVILMELEVWPNFIAECQNRSIPVIVANGRITEASFKNYRLGSWLTRRMFRRLDAVCAQEQTYADRFLALGANPKTVSVTGTMKFDTAPQSPQIAGADELAEQVGLTRPLWVCGSTGPGEEPLVLAAYRSLLEAFSTLRLAIIPRKPERFDEVAALISDTGFACVRRSTRSTLRPESEATPIAAVILGDTMGELRKFYAHADVVFVGRTLLDLGEKQHGSDMIEPTALGKPTVVGPFTGNFAEVMNALRAGTAIVEIKSPVELGEAIQKLLTDPGDIGQRARQVVESQRGATDRTLAVIAPLLWPVPDAVPTPEPVVGTST